MPDSCRTRQIGLAPALAASLLLSVLAGCDRQPAKPPVEVAVASTEVKTGPPPSSEPSRSPAKKQFVGSKTCHDCHAKFYELWSTSRHGLAMQPYSPAFAKKELKPQTADVVIGKQSFRAEIGEKQGWVRETSGDKETHYPIAHVMGGKNVYYFLTPMARGPLAGPARGLRRPQEGLVRHGGQRRAALSRPPRRGPALDRPLFTFNTTCFNCHVSRTGDQLRPGDRHLPHHLARAGHQLRVVPRPRRRAHRRPWRPASRATRSKDIKIIRTHRVQPRADERHVRHLPRQAGAAVDRLLAGRQVLRPLRPDHAGTRTTSIPTAATWARTTRSPPGR